MKTWICKVCDYAYQGEEPPLECPKCGSPRSQFYLKKQGGNKALTIMIIFVIGCGILCAFLACKSTLTVDNSPVQTINLHQYLGRWYEIARFDHRFERNMQQCTANYALQSDGTIRITNQGLKKGKWKTSVGKGKLTDKAGLLRVSFFGPFYSDYRILMLAPDYSYSLVGGSDDSYLWILSRTPQLESTTRDTILQEARRRGYHTENLIWVQQRQ